MVERDLCRKKGDDHLDGKDNGPEIGQASKQETDSFYDFDRAEKSGELPDKETLAAKSASHPCWRTEISRCLHLKKLDRQRCGLK